MTETTQKKRKPKLIGGKTKYLVHESVWRRYVKKTGSKVTHQEYSEMIRTLGEYIARGLLEGRIWHLPKAWGVILIRQKKNDRHHGIVMAWGDNVSKKRKYGEYHYFDGALDPIARTYWSFSGVKHKHVNWYTFRPCEWIKRAVHIRIRVHKQTYIRLY